MATRNHTRTFLGLREQFDRRRVRPDSSGATTAAATAAATASAVRRRGAASAAQHASSDFHALEDDENDEEAAMVDASATGGGAEANGGAGDAGQAPRPTLPPRWVDVVEQVEADVRDARAKLQDLDELHKQRLMVRFEDEKDAAREADIQNLTRLITKRIRDAERGIQAIGAAGGGPRGNEDAKVRLNVQRLTASKAQELSLEFRRMQRQYMSQVAALNRGGGGFAGLAPARDGGAAPDDPLRAGARERERDPTAYVELGQANVQALESAQETVREREAEITRIAQNIEELATIFKSLASLVIEQGTILDRIDANMELVVQRTEKGVSELDKAAQYAESWRFVYCVTALVVVILVLLGIETAKLT